MEAEAQLERIGCPACGGAGGGPFGRAGSAWDDDEYVCPRCKGEGVIARGDEMVQSQRPGIVKAVPDAAAAAAEKDGAEKKRKASA